MPHKNKITDQKPKYTFRFISVLPKQHTYSIKHFTLLGKGTFCVNKSVPVMKLHCRLLVASLT